ncbi:hypothetical protein [Achromobacter arsenitoxydans]|uniref:hypothetical protein n=1 Tax=Achromobacter arsenitoxydans TaxID=1147684 RepID=UPI00031D05DB|nr:hypothetical protein [Achromobacter arsenitoxydans]
MARTSLHVAAVAGVISLAVLAACGKKDPYPPEVQRETYSSCVAGFKSKVKAMPEAEAKAAKYCNCVVDGLQESVPYKDFKELDQQLATQTSTPDRDRLSKGVMDVVNACLKRELPKG